MTTTHNTVNNQYVEKLIKKWRPVLGIDPRWKIHVSFMAEYASDGFDGKTIFDSQRWEATLVFLDTLRPEEIERVIVHELLELASYELAELWWNLVDEYVEDRQARIVFDRSMAAARNRFIETLVPLLIEKHG